MGEDPNPQTMASPLCWQIKQTVHGISYRILWAGSSERGVGALGRPGGPLGCTSAWG